MQGIQPLWEEMPVSRFRAAAEVKTEEIVNPFTDIFRQAIDAVKETDAEKVQMEYLTATGQLDNPALLSIASTKAQLSVEFLMQLRTRATEVYNELMRMNL